MAPGVFHDALRARRRETARRLAQLQHAYVVLISVSFFSVCVAYIIWGHTSTQQVWPKAAGRALPTWIFSPWVWALITGLHGGSLFAALTGPPVIVHTVTRSKFVCKAGVWWAAGFLCEAIAFGTAAHAASSRTHLLISAAALLAAACSFHVPVLGPNFRPLYRSYMITWVALDAVAQSQRRSDTQTRDTWPRRQFNSSPDMATGGDSPGHIALATLAVSPSSRNAPVAVAQNLGRVSPPPRQAESGAAAERASEFFNVHLQLALVTVATSIHAALLLAPAANVLLAAVDGGGVHAGFQNPTVQSGLRFLLLGAVVGAWAVAVCVRWNVIYGVSACCVLLSLPVGQGLLEAVRSGDEPGEPLWAALSSSPRLLVGVSCVALAALLAVAVVHFVALHMWEVVVGREHDRHGGVLGNSGYLGSEALEEPLAGPSASEQLLQSRHAAHRPHSFEMNALMEDDSDLESL